MFAEAPETFTVMLSEEESAPDELPDGVELQRSTATATIADDETLTARVMGPGTVAADVPQPVQYPVTLEGGTVSATVVVNYTVSGSASDDFAPKSGSLPIVTGSSGTITLQRLHRYTKRKRDVGGDTDQCDHLGGKGNRWNAEGGEQQDHRDGNPDSIARSD